ncbi:MAG: putative membrane protein [Microgenomates group bacterium GW2011_GWA2_46_7]|nr:MAG: putative membrane protein [Microgenomates group bacterium GW2011_GWA2_46_7]
MNISLWQQSLSNVWGSTIGTTFDFLPNLFGAILVALAGIIIGNWVRTIIVRSLQLIRFENIIKDTKFKAFLVKAELTEKLEEVIGSVIKWLIVLTFFIAATNIVGLGAVSAVLEGVLSYIPNVLSAVIVLAIGVLLAGLVESLVKGALASVDLKTSRLMGKVASYTVITIAVLAAFSELKIAESFINILFIGFVAMLTLGFGLAIGLGAKDVVGKALSDWYSDLKKELKH